MKVEKRGMIMSTSITAQALNQMGITNWVRREIPYVGNKPEKSRSLDAAYDLRAKAAGYVPPGERVAVETGTQVGIPEGYVGLVCPRSGLALRHGITVLNSPGVVDPGYTGDVSVILHNTSKVNFHFAEGDRIAQLLVFKPEQITFAHGLGVAAAMTERGDEGFGSSGVK